MSNDDPTTPEFDLAAAMSSEPPIRLPTPPYVQTGEQLRRWWISTRISEAISRLHEPDHQPNFAFVWTTTREIFFSDAPIGSIDDLNDEELARLGLSKELLRAALREQQANHVFPHSIPRRKSS